MGAIGRKEEDGKIVEEELPPPKPPDLKLPVLIEAVENYRPQFMVIDEIGTKHKAMTMGYYLEGKTIWIRSDPALSRQLVEPKSLLKLTNAGSWTFVWDLGLVEKQVDGEWPNDWTAEQKAELGMVLQAHYRVFQEIPGLPPPQDIKYPYRIKFETWKFGFDLEKQNYG